MTIFLKMGRDMAFLKPTGNAFHKRLACTVKLNVLRYHRTRERLMSSIGHLQADIYKQNLANSPKNPRLNIHNKFNFVIPFWKCIRLLSSWKRSGVVIWCSAFTGLLRMLRCRACRAFKFTCLMHMKCV